jgi:hypothetical protein
VDGREAEDLQLARERLALARRIRDLVQEQQQAVAALPEEEAVGRFLALADARQECTDRFDQLPSTQSECWVETEIQAVFTEAARIDTENRQIMEQHREQLREEIRRVRQGREALRSYGRQEPGGETLDEGAFIDRKK